MIKRSFVLRFTFLLFCILVSLFLFAKYNAAEEISYKPNIWKYKHTTKRHSFTNCLIWSAIIMTSLPLCAIKNTIFQTVIYMQAFLGFSRSFLKLLRFKIVKCWLNEIKRHFFLRQSLFLIVVRRSLPRFPGQKNIIDISQWCI